MPKKWGNSILEVNVKHIACYYCGNVIKDKSWFKIKRLRGHAFTFCEPLCEQIWDQKTSA